LNVALPLTSTIISFIAAILVFDQYLNRHKPYQLVWTVGFVWFGVSACTEFLGSSQGWNETLYRVWFLFGAYLVAAYLGMGTTYLLTPRRFAHAVMALLLLGSVYAAYLVITAPVDLSQFPRPGEIPTSAPLPQYVRSTLLIVFNSFGTIALVAGALYSAWIFMRKRILPHRVASNVLIALGTIVVASGGSLHRAGMPQFFFAAELGGILLIFIGFLVSIEIFEEFKLPFVKVSLGRRRPASVDGK